MRGVLLRFRVLGEREHRTARGGVSVLITRLSSKDHLRNLQLGLFLTHDRYLVEAVVEHAGGAHRRAILVKRLHKGSACVVIEACIKHKH